MAPSLRHNEQHMLFGICCSLLFLSACAPTVTPTPFVPPTDANAQPAQATTVIFTTSTPEPQNSSQSSSQSSGQSSQGAQSSVASSLPAVTTTPEACTNSLKFVADLTIPDGTAVSAGAAVDKQWSVQNDGTCDWVSGYVLKLVSGDPMGTAAEIALYPARAGEQAVIDMQLTAPEQAGPYHTVWQAYTPDGTPFDQPIYVDIVVQ